MPRGKQLTDAQRQAREKERVEKFKTLGSKRLNNALTAIRRLQPLANKNQYTYTEDQVKLIQRHLTEATEAVIDSFKGKEVAATGITL